MRTAHEENSVTAILLSYLRPENVQKIFGQLAKSKYIGKIIVSNNNPDIDLCLYIEQHPKLSLIQQVVHYPPWIRFEFAAHDSANYFLSIDDDIFLSLEQIDLLLERLFNGPAVPHGVWGQRIVNTPKGLKLVDGVQRENRSVDVLNRVYACTKEHVLNSFRLLKILGLNHARKIGPFEDVLLSFGSMEKPLCHDLGVLDECDSSSSMEKALHMKPGFIGLRQQLVLDIFERSKDIPWLGADRCKVVEFLDGYERFLLET
ncbi:hypothetical protein [Hahella chejuensis]|uniref:hypothetical protein n=1 Tax=Hahella chejuensis TaxID=158327 RepID=UPI0011D12A56|nr:hypothetical protein [Hahella chejuensis]